MSRSRSDSLRGKKKRNGAALDEVQAVPLNTTNSSPLNSAEPGRALNSLERRGWRRRQITVFTPPVPPATGLGVGVGTAWFGKCIAAGNTDPHLVWPSLVAVALGMAYDLGRRFLARNETHR